MLTIEKHFDWATFTVRYWDRRPVLFKAVVTPPFAETEVFRAAVRAARAQDGRSPLPTTQFTIERLQRSEPGDQLPRDEDTSFDDYQERVGALLRGRRYALIINGFHSFDHGLWARERAFYAGLWEQVGLPLTGAITTMFHGTYEHSPVGVHKDRFATFMFGLRGRKRMRFWPSRPWTEPVTTILDYGPYVPESFAAEVEPGDLLYWPSSYFHVGESAGTEPATSVNVGVPREEHHAGYDVEDLLADLDPELLADRKGSGIVTRLPPVDAPLTAPGADPTGRLPADVPSALAQAVRVFGPERRLRDRISEVSLRRWTAGGFEPVPSAAPRRPISDETIVRGDVRFPVLWAGHGETGGMCSVNGHAVCTAVPPRDLQRILPPLRSGEPVEVGDLLRAGTAGGSGTPRAGRDEVRQLLEHLESFRGITRMPAA